MTRKTLKPRRGKAKKSSGRKQSIDQRFAVAPESGDKEKPIPVFSENVGASWPTPDNLDNASANEEQSGVEDVRRDPKGGPRGPRVR